MDPRHRLTKRERAAYRTSTGLALAVMLFSIVNFVFDDHFPFPNGPEGAFAHLGFPAYFKVVLGDGDKALNRVGRHGQALQRQAKRAS
jgi:hypothetical protein